MLAIKYNSSTGYYYLVHRDHFWNEWKTIKGPDGKSLFVETQEEATNWIKNCEDIGRIKGCELGNPKYYKLKSMEKKTIEYELKQMMFEG